MGAPLKVPVSCWTVRSPAGHYQRHETFHNDITGMFEAEITAGEKMEGVNRLILEMVAAGRPTVCLVPISIIGK